MTASKILEIFRSWLGATKYGSTHKHIIDTYNSKHPLPQGYRVTYDDEWCDATVSTAFIKAGLLDLIGQECSVQRHINICKSKGIWLGKQRPQAGDLVMWDWDGNGWGDHIGIVESVAGDTITAIEGNTTKNGVSCVGRNQYKWNDWRIQGYARPKYGASAALAKSVNELAQEVINGLHGTGDDRKRALGAQYDAVQKRVNELLGTNNEPIAFKLGNYTLTQSVLDKILALCKHYDILPSFAITVLHYEGLWGNSNVGKSDKNWGGMTWTGDPQRKSGVVVTKGSARPASEGGHYMRYASVDDFLKDWFYLLRKGGIYQVAGQKSFEACVKGMFKVGGATYDYAGAGYEKYLIGMATRKKDIEQVNGSLSKYDATTIKEATQDDIKVDRDNLEVFINGVRYVRDTQ